MTQQPMYPQQPQQAYPPQYPGQPQPQYAPAPAPPVQYAPVPQQQAYAPMPQAPAQPLATGSIDDFYNQPSSGGGPSISWQNKPEGTSYSGIVARDVTQGDIQQQTNFQTKAPEFYRDGRPKFSMKVPLMVTPSQEHPEGEAAWFVKGQARDELARAMAEAGVSGAPKAGDAITVTLVQRKQMKAGLNPANVVRVAYQSANGAAAPQATPVAEAPSPVSAPVQPEVQQFQPPVVQQQPQFQQPVQQVAPQQVVQQVPQQAQASPPAPAGLTPEQQQLLAQLNAKAQAS